MRRQTLFVIFCLLMLATHAHLCWCAGPLPLPADLSANAIHQRIEQKRLSEIKTLEDQLAKALESMRIQRAHGPIQHKTVEQIRQTRRELKKIRASRASYVPKINPLQLRVGDIGEFAWPRTLDNNAGCTITTTKFCVCKINPDGSIVIEPVYTYETVTAVAHSQGVTVHRGGTSALPQRYSFKNKLHTTKGKRFQIANHVHAKAGKPIDLPGLWYVYETTGEMPCLLRVALPSKHKQ